MKLKLKTIVLSLLYPCLFLATFLDAATFQVILVGDTNSNLREQTEADLKTMTTHTQQMANAMGLPFRMHLFRDRHANGPEIIKAIDNLKIAADDVVLFYFSGHGCRSNQKSSPWPYLFFQEPHQFMALDEVLDHLYEKHPRFALVVADCCNNYENDKMPDTSYFNFQTLSQKIIDRNIRNLFLQSSGFLVISGAEPGGFSWASEEGGILTSAFLDGLSSREFYPSKTWNVLMSEIKDKTRGIQSPQYAFYNE